MRRRWPPWTRPWEGWPRDQTNKQSISQANKWCDRPISWPVVVDIGQRTLRRRVWMALSCSICLLICWQRASSGCLGPMAMVSHQVQAGLAYLVTTNAYPDTHEEPRFVGHYSTGALCAGYMFAPEARCKSCQVYGVPSEGLVPARWAHDNLSIVSCYLRTPYTGLYIPT
ncbi:hypothetical protein F4802DRAFT_583573 [Xylaria palmicola]|nr:hypothetical protein F4802DRAFT_583573 [Xylaria palmicola]